MGFLPGWNFRKSKIVNGTTFGSQTNYTLQLTVYKGTGTDTNTDIYLNDNCNDDFSDIRFTSQDGETLLDYYIESMIAGVSAVIDIEVDSIPASPGSSTIYIYYGNTDAITQSNPDNTFSFYDNGSGSDFNIKWQILAGSGSYMGFIYIAPNSIIAVKNQLPINFKLIYDESYAAMISFSAIHDIKLSKETTQRNISRLYSTYTGPEGSSTYTPVIEGVTKSIIDTIPEGGMGYVTVTHLLGIGWTTSMASSVSQATLRNSSNTLFLHFATPASEQVIYNIIVRKFASPEPTFSTTGAEERPSAIITGRSSFSSRGASVSGGIACGRGKKR